MRHFLITRIGAAAAVFGLLGGAVLISAGARAQDGRPPAADAAMPTGRSLVLEIQRHLAGLGFEPGPADGLLGEQTRETIRAFERERGLPVTGEPTPEILRLLREAPAGGSPSQQAEAAAPSAPAPEEPPPQRAVKPVPIAEATSESTLAGTTWIFRDESGAEFSARFEPDGTLSGPAFSRGWAWTQDGGAVELTYDNRVGGSTTRTGELLSGREMAGRGESSRGVEWSWQASRTR